MHISRPQRFETCYLAQEKIWKDYKCTEVKEHPTKNACVDQEIKEEIKSTRKPTKMKT